MAELYLTLVSGRTVHVCSDWDGAAPTRIGTVDAAGDPDDGEGIEAGEYYRDSFRMAATGDCGVNPDLNVQGTIPGVGSIKVDTSGGLGPISDVTVTPTLTTPSDEVAHVKPRTWQKVCTWLVFTGTAGTYHWRAASVDGWSSKAPVD